MMMRWSRKYWAVLRAGLVLAWIRVALRFHTLPTILTRLHPGRQAGARARGQFEDIVYYVDRWLRLFPYNAKGNCFPRSLALYWFARRAGYQVAFRCGVRKEGAGLDGHAWLTLDRLPFHEPGQHWQHFTVTFSHPPEQAVHRKQGVPARAGNGMTAAT